MRKQKNLSQTELGKLAGLHYTHTGRFERGTSRPSGDTLIRLANAGFEDRELLKQLQALAH